MSKEITVVIGHRMGKGQAVARGVEKAGGKAIVIPGGAVYGSQETRFNLSNT